MNTNFNNDGWIALFMAVLCIGIPTVIVSFIVYSSNHMHQEECRKNWQDSSYQYRWVEGAGCQVLTSKGWVNERVLREVEK